MAEETTSRPSITALVERLKEDGYEWIASAIIDGDLSELQDSDLALVDALAFGFGALVSGKRVNPLTLRLIEYSPKGSA